MALEAKEYATRDDKEIANFFSAMTTTADYGGRRASGRKVKNGGSLGDGDGGGGDDLYQQHLDDLEERTLLRGMESYGPENFALFRFMLLPVYGSTRRAPSVGQVQRTSKTTASSNNSTLPISSTAL